MPTRATLFALCEEAESENRLAALDDLRFAKLGEQWPESVRQQRIKDGRPCLTINRRPAFIRQVVNEARQNRPGSVCIRWTARRMYDRGNL